MCAQPLGSRSIRAHERIVLFGWSMGAAIALQLAAEREFEGVIGALVIDSPVLDWTATINANCARAGLPLLVRDPRTPVAAQPRACRRGWPGRLLSRSIDFNWIERAVGSIGSNADPPRE